MLIAGVGIVEVMIMLNDVCWKGRRDAVLYPNDAMLNGLYARQHASDSISERELLQVYIDYRTYLVETMTPVELQAHDSRYDIYEQRKQAVEAARMVAG